MIGLLFLVSGTEKLLNPIQNFLYVVQSYAVFPDPLDKIVSYVVPWIELFVGLFLFLGLWLEKVLFAASMLFGIFVLIIVQALIRRLPLTECGCFGGLISFPLPVTLVMDSLLFVLTIGMNVRLEKTNFLSLDKIFK